MSLVSSIPSISIIMPIYNVEKYLEDSINSVLNQDFDNYELILIDDGSPDRCPKICDEFAAKDSRIRVIHIPNGGVSAARNKGIQASRGKYLYFIDPDDFLPVNGLRELWAAVELFDFPDYIKGGHNVILRDNSLKISAWNKKVADYEYKVIPLDFFLEKVILPHPLVWNGLIKRTLFEEGLQFQDSISYREDMIFHLQMATIPGITEKRGIFIPKITYTYRLAVEGSLSNHYTLRILGSMVLVPKMIEELKSNIKSDRIKKIANSELQGTIRAIFIFLPRTNRKNFNRLIKSFKDSYPDKLVVEKNDPLFIRISKTLYNISFKSYGFAAHVIYLIIPETKRITK